MFKISTAGQHTCLQSIAVVFHSVVNGLLRQGRPNHLKCISSLNLGTVFTALHGMQTQSYDEKSVRPSVRPSVHPSVKCVNCDKTKEKSVQMFTPYERPFIVVFWEEEWFVGVTPFTLNFGSTDPRWSEIAHFEPIIARSASAVTPSEKSSINTNRKSTTRFPMSLWWSSYVAS